MTSTNQPGFGVPVVWRSCLGTPVAQHLRVVVLGCLRPPPSHHGRKSLVSLKSELVQQASLTGEGPCSQLAHCQNTRLRASVTLVHFSLWDHIGNLTIFYRFIGHFFFLSSPHPPPCPFTKKEERVLIGGWLSNTLSHGLYYTIFFPCSSCPHSGPSSYPGYEPTVKCS